MKEFGNLATINYIEVIFIISKILTHLDTSEENL